MLVNNAVDITAAYLTNSVYHAPLSASLSYTTSSSTSSSFQNSLASTAANLVNDSNNDTAPVINPTAAISDTFPILVDSTNEVLTQPEATTNTIPAATEQGFPLFNIEAVLSVDRSDAGTVTVDAFTNSTNKLMKRAVVPPDIFDYRTTGN